MANHDLDLIAAEIFELGLDAVPDILQRHPSIISRLAVLSQWQDLIRFVKRYLQHLSPQVPILQYAGYYEVARFAFSAVVVYGLDGSAPYIATEIAAYTHYGFNPEILAAVSAFGVSSALSH